jgi:hypothetical protein
MKTGSPAWIRNTVHGGAARRNVMPWCGFIEMAIHIHSGVDKKLSGFMATRKAS